MNEEQAKQLIKEAVFRNFNFEGFVVDALDLVLKPALDKMVADSENPYDDVAVAALYPVLVPLLKGELKAQIDKLKA